MTTFPRISSVSSYSRLYAFVVQRPVCMTCTWGHSTPPVPPQETTPSRPRSSGRLSADATIRGKREEVIMTTSGTSSSWWDSIEVYSDDCTPQNYLVSTSVETNHASLQGMGENDFDTSDISYTHGHLTLAVVFLVASLLACVCLPCCYQCAGESRRERLRERLMTRVHRPGDTAKGGLMLICSIMAIVSALGAIASLEKADSGLTSIEGHTQGAADDLRTDAKSTTGTATSISG